MTIRALILASFLLCAGCATLPPPTPPLAPGKEVETLQSAVTIAVRAGENSTGGHGYLIYQRPDRFHLVLLAPFGTTLFEVFLDGARITWVVPSKNLIYTGLVSELPDENVLRSWGLMRWASERPPADGAGRTRTFSTPDGGTERVTYDSLGLVTEKEDGAGDRVLYQDYADVNGSAVPKTVELHDRRGVSVRLVFDEPEVNQPLAEAAFTPMTEGMTILPLAAFKGW